MPDLIPNPGKPAPQGGECDKTSSQHTSANVAGTDTCIYNNGIDNRFRLGDKAIDWKASKQVFIKHGIKDSQIQALAILWLYCQFTGKENTGCNIQQVTNWSGFGIRWSTRLAWHFDNLIALGMIERIPFNGGFRLFLTAKGEYILKCWDDERVKIIEGLKAKQVIARLKAETKKLNLQRLHNIRNSRGQFEPSKGQTRQS